MADAKSWSWGDDEDSFPVALWDEFDGKIENIEYEDGTYGAQIHLIIRPAEYEFDPRGLEYDGESDEGLPQGWYSMGGKVDTYDVSDDAMDIVGPKPQKNCNAVKLQMGMVEHSDLKRRDIRDAHLKYFQGLGFHWKAITWKGKVNGVDRETNRLFPSGKVVGKPIIGGVKEDSRRTRRSGQEESVEEESVESVASVEVGSDSNSSVSNEDALELLLDVIDEAGDEGLKRSTLASALLGKQEESGEDLVTAAANRDLLKQAIDDGKILQKGRILTVISE